MRPHISLDVRDVSKSVVLYEKVFGMTPQKQVEIETVEEIAQ